MYPDPHGTPGRPDEPQGKRPLAARFRGLPVSAWLRSLPWQHHVLGALRVWHLAVITLALLTGGLGILLGWPALISDRSIPVYLSVIGPDGEITSGGVTPILAKDLDAAAAAALPSYLEAAGPLYEVGAIPADAQLVFSTPNTPGPIASLDVYRWLPIVGTWEFIPATLDIRTGSFTIAGTSGLLGLFQVELDPLLGAALGPDDDLPTDLGQGFDLILAAPLSFNQLGAIQPAGPPIPGDAFARLRPIDRAQGARLLADPAAQASLVEETTNLVRTSSLPGMVLDLGPLDSSEWADALDLVTRVRAALPDEVLLGVQVPTPSLEGTTWDTAGYDWTALGETGTLIIVEPPGGLGAFYTGGFVDTFLLWATQQVNRANLILSISALSQDEWAGLFTPLAFDYALHPLGDIALSIPGANPGERAQSGDELRFNTQAQSLNLMRDANSGVFSYEVIASDGQHRIWINTPAALRARLDWLASHEIGGYVIDGIFSTRAAPGILTSLREFQEEQAASVEPGFPINWVVSASSGEALIEMSTSLEEPLIWTPELAGSYTVRAELAGDSPTIVGQREVLVAQGDVGKTGLQEGLVVGGAPEIGRTLQGIDTLPAGLPAPVYPPGAAAQGAFELGGQVNHVIRNRDFMQQAGMTWVKFQLAWHPDMDPTPAQLQIQEGHAAGFKVLISIVGVEKYPTGINVPKFLEFLQSVAYYGPDAIEVWNEPNLDYEWPRGEISGANFVKWMLAPAYNAIKEVNPNIMVISGAPAPNGAFFGEGGCSAAGYGCDDWLFVQQMAQSGAANYMDCVGVHYNAGATAPSANTGHPADPGYQHYSWYFSGMLQLYGGSFGHKVCFTELGYLSPQGYGSPPSRFSWATETSVDEQAAWLAEAAQLSRESGRVRLMIVWNVDFLYWGDDPMAGYAIVRPDGTCPACQTLDAVMP